MRSEIWLWVIVFAGLFPILKGGKWNWNVAPESRVANWMFWFGGIAVLVVAVIETAKLL